MRLLACMCAAFAVCAAVVSSGGAHRPGYCGHTAKYWSVWSYGSQIHYREVFRNMYNSGGSHFHEYDSQYQTTLGGWVTLHHHIRECGSVVV